MRKLSLAAVAVCAALLAACGADSKSCSTTGATVASSNVVPSSCSAAPGQTVDIPVALCSQCTDSSPGCADPIVDTAERIVDLNPTVQQCTEDAGCANDRSCALQNNQVVCHVTVPANAPTGSYDIKNARTGSTIGTLNVGSTGGCSFGLASAPAATP